MLRRRSRVMAVTRVSTAATLFVVVARATVELSPPHLRGSDMGVPLRLLLVEDSENDALLLVRELTRAGFEPVVERVETAVAMQAALDRQGWDIVLGDYSMPQFGGAGAPAPLREGGHDVPLSDVYADPAERQRLLDRDSYTEREYDEVEATWKRKDGRRLTVQLSVRAVRDGSGGVEYYETFVRDVTEQRRLEGQLLQAQKMEAVGRLAGGVAHDFNNLLTVILSYSDLLLEDLPPEIPDRADVAEIRKAAVAASSLTRQLLAFSRQQVLEPRVLDVNTVVASTEKLLTRLLGEDVSLTTTLAAALGAVKVDPGQLEQIIMNLAVNARDAMPRVGRLSIETANVEMDESYVHGHPLARPGHYVMLAVSDTGTGMDAATQARIFEPFFTTKEAGKGTGLGLATVYGIVRQSSGFIWVYSEPGHGTSFKIYLPRVDEPVSPAGAAAPQVVGGSETVLVVEDVAAVRAVTRQMLERQGYCVLEAANGATALSLARQHQSAIHLLVTDVVMPEVSGRELADQLVQLRPDMKVLFMSGYTDDAVVRHGILQEGIAYLQKPFTPDTLARKVRAVLDGS